MSPAFALTPFGIYEVQFADAPAPVMVYVSETQSVFGPVAFLSGRLNEATGHANHLPFWRALWLEDKSTFYAEGFSRRDVQSIELVLLSPDEVRGEIITTDERFSPAGQPMRAAFYFSGHRHPSEVALSKLAARSAVLTSEAEGIYTGSVGGEKTQVQFVLRSHPRGPERVWVGSYRLGQFSLPVTGYADEQGLLRLVRTPTASPSELSGVTGTIVRNAAGEMEFHGFFFCSTQQPAVADGAQESSRSEVNHDLSGDLNLRHNT